MTSHEIMTAALLQLDRSADALFEWRDKFLCHINDAAEDIARSVRLAYSEKVKLFERRFEPSALTRPCIRIYSVKNGGDELKFSFTAPDQPVYVKAREDMEVLVTYRAMPRMAVSESDEPDVPAVFHPLIVSYVVARERMSGDVSTQYGASAYLDMYEAGKRKLAREMKDPSCFSIYNRF